MRRSARVLAWMSALFLGLAPAVVSADPVGAQPRAGAQGTGEPERNRPVAGPLAGRPIERTAILPPEATLAGVAIVGALVLCLAACSGGGGGGSAPSTNNVE